MSETNSQALGATERELPPHVSRMIDEQNELVSRIGKLREFIKENPRFGELSMTDQVLMAEQETAMNVYLVVLTARIERAINPRQEPPQR